jgi:hypothetical protein
MITQLLAQQNKQAGDEPVSLVYDTKVDYETRSLSPLKKRLNGRV